MKIGIFLAVFRHLTLDKAIENVKKLGINMVEISTANHPNNSHCNAEILLKSKIKLKEFKSFLKKNEITISALSCHCNPVHPNEKTAHIYRATQKRTILLAEKLDVKRIITFSGCPGGSRVDITPNWIICPWPEELFKALQWQWEERLFPFWIKEASFARDHGVKICIEMHPGFPVYNPETLMKLRNICGKNIGANLDPSHLFWQGIDPANAVKVLKDAIFHIHIKDTKIDDYNTKRNGVLDTKPYNQKLKRSWIFRTVGYGHGASFWRDFISALRMVGYNDVLSIEYEDSLMSADEGLTKAVQFLKSMVPEEK